MLLRAPTRTLTPKRMTPTTPATETRDACTGRRNHPLAHCGLKNVRVETLHNVANVDNLLIRRAQWRATLFNVSTMRFVRPHCTRGGIPATCMVPLMTYRRFNYPLCPLYVPKRVIKTPHTNNKSRSWKSMIRQINTIRL